MKTGKALYKLTTKMTDDYKLEVTASPDYPEISNLYRALQEGIDKEILANMPERTYLKILNQLLERFINTDPALVDIDAKNAAYLIRDTIKASYGI